jgi:hypothetical protein
VPPNIDPSQPQPPQGASSGSEPGSDGHDAFVSAMAWAESGAVPEMDDAPPSPPRYLAANIAAARRAWDSLAAAGRHVAFELGPNGRVSIELQDAEGNLLSTVGPSQLFELIDQESGR